MISFVSEGLAPIRFSRRRFHSSLAPPFDVIRSAVFGADVVKDAEDEVSAAAGALPESACAGCAPEPRWVHQYQPPSPSSPEKISSNSPTSRRGRSDHSGVAFVLDSP